MTTNAPVPETSRNGGQARILVPLDGSELAEKALPVAEGLCRQLSAQLDLVSILQLAVIPYVGGEPYIPGDVYTRIDAERRQEIEKYLASTAAKTRERGIATQTHIDRGDPASGVLDKAKEHGTMLIVMTTHGRTGLMRFALGSVADRVVRGGVAPVLLVRSFPEPTHGQDLSHALIPLDGSPLAEAPVFSLVPQLAGTVLRTITLLRVADPRDGEAGRQVCEDYLTAIRQRLVDHLVDRDCAISVLVRSGKNPAASIVEASQDGECDLVLMATHGEAGIGRWAFGGVTDRVLRDGKAPLLLMQPEPK
jgi:nucleotide-binding universal stress UspA family protein